MHGELAERGSCVIGFKCVSRDYRFESHEKKVAETQQFGLATLAGFGCFLIFSSLTVLLATGKRRFRPFGPSVIRARITLGSMLPSHVPMGMDVRVRPSVDKNKACLLIGISYGGFLAITSLGASCRKIPAPRSEKTFAPNDQRSADHGIGCSFDHLWYPLCIHLRVSFLNSRK